jgi:hypothetical protein
MASISSLDADELRLFPNLNRRPCDRQTFARGLEVSLLPCPALKNASRCYGSGRAFK